MKRTVTFSPDISRLSFIETNSKTKKQRLLIFEHTFPISLSSRTRARRKKAGLNMDGQFLIRQIYDDEITYNLITAAVEILSEFNFSAICHISLIAAYAGLYPTHINLFIFRRAWCLIFQNPKYRNSRRRHPRVVWQNVLRFLPGLWLR